MYPGMLRGTHVVLGIYTSSIACKASNLLFAPSPLHLIYIWVMRDWASYGSAQKYSWLWVQRSDLVVFVLTTWKQVTYPSPVLSPWIRKLKLLVQQKKKTHPQIIKTFWINIPQTEFWKFYFLQYRDMAILRKTLYIQISNILFDPGQILHLIKTCIFLGYKKIGMLQSLTEIN